MTGTDVNEAVSYSRRECRRCGASMNRVQRRWLGDGWRCPNHGRQAPSGSLQS